MGCSTWDDDDVRYSANGACCMVQCKLCLLYGTVQIVLAVWDPI